MSRRPGADGYPYPSQRRSVVERAGQSGLVGPRTGPSGLSARCRPACRFDPQSRPFGAFEDRPTPSDWDEMASLVGPGGTVAIIGTGDDGLESRWAGR